METRNFKALVYKIILFMITCLHFSYAKTISIQWSSGKTKECHELVLKFLNELKEHTNDDLIEFSTESKTKKTEDSIQLECQSSMHKTPVLQFTHQNDTVILHYLGVHAGFDSLDWVQFQRKFISDTNIEPSLASASMQYSTDTSPELNDTKTNTSSQLALTALSATTGIFGGAYFSPNRESRTVNMLIFGSLSGLAGYLLSQSLFGE